MNRFFIYLIMFITFSFISIGCTSDDGCKVNSDCKDNKVCIDESCKVDPTQGELEFFGINDGAFIDGYRFDEDGEKSGVQLDIYVKTKDVKDGTPITLMLKGDENTKVTENLKILGDGTSVVKFSAFTLKEGENELVASSKDKNSNNISSSIKVNSKELILSITSPQEGDTIKVSEDQVPEMFYIQKDVSVTIDGLVQEGTTYVKLVLYKGEMPIFSKYAEPNEGVVVFKDVSFSKGPFKLIASVTNINGETISSPPVNVTAEDSGACNVSVTPASETVINTEYLVLNNIQNKEVKFSVESECPAGFKVKYTLNGTVIGEGTLVEEAGKAVSSLSHVLPENTENGGPSLLRVDISEDFSNSSADGGFAEASYIVDTVGPNFVEITKPAVGAIYNEENDLDGNISNGIQLYVAGKVTGATSDLKVYVNDIQNPIGGVQTYSNAINNDGDFDTEALPGNQYTNVTTGGDVTLIFEAVDEHGNKSSKDVLIKSFLTNPNQLSVDYVNEAKYKNPKNNINLTSDIIDVKVSKFLENPDGAKAGDLSLELTYNGDPYTYDVSYEIDSATNLIRSFTLENLNDGRYVMIPKFKDFNEFVYSGIQGFINVKTSTPTYSNLNLVQDIDGNNVLNIAEDKLPAQPELQTDVKIDLANLYLDLDDCTEENRLQVRLLKGSETGSELAVSNKVTCDGKVQFSDVTLPEGKYTLFFSVTDNFGNLGVFTSQEITVDITPPNADSLLLVFNSGTEKTIVADMKLLSLDDLNKNLEGFQSNFKVYSTDSQTVKLVVGPVDETKTLTNNEADFGELTINNGVNTFTLTATDENGNVTTKTIENVVVDTLIPELTIAMNKVTVTDADDEDNSTPGIQATIQVNAMMNIEDGQVVSIQRGVDDGNGNITWNNLHQFTKTSNNSESFLLTFPLGEYKLRAIASDQNNQEGVSNVIDLNVSSSNCSILSVKKGSVELSAGTNFFNASDVTAGSISLEVSYTASCSSLGASTLVVKKNDTEVVSEAIKAELKNTITVSVTEGEASSLTFEINSTPLATVSHDIYVDTVLPSVSRVTPSNESITYVNANNPSIDGTTKIGDLNNVVADAQISITVQVQNAMNGAVELLVDDLVVETDSTIGTNAENVTFLTTVSDNTSHTLKFRVTDQAGNQATTLLYNLVVDVTNPGNLSGLSYDGLSVIERRTAELALKWNQSATDDVEHYMIKYSPVAFADTDFETLSGDDLKTQQIDNPDLSNAEYNVLLSKLLFNKTYSIGVRAYDEVGNASNILVLSTNNDLKLLSTQLNTDPFGTDTLYKVKDVGDIDDDGHSDFVVTQYNGGDGAIYIYYGTIDMATPTPPQVIKGTQWGYDLLGSSVTSGDFDGDGKTDLLIGAVWTGNYGLNYPGGVFVYYNQGNGADINPSDRTLIKNSVLDDVANLRIVFGEGLGGLGESVDKIGKINGSSFDSFVIGQNLSADGGRAFIIEGRAGKPAEIDLDTASNVVELSHDFGATAKFGSSVTGLGDLYDDGTFDVAVGDLVSKKVSIYNLGANVFSQTTLEAKSDNTGAAIVLSDAGDNYGAGLMGNHDLNGDGYKDLVVSGLTTGLFVYYGTASGILADTSYARIVSTNTGTSWNNNFNIFDVNNDGKEDIVVGETKKLNIYVSGDENFTTVTKPDIIIDGVADFDPDVTGILKASSFDVNEDGLDDFIICDLGSKNCFIKY